MDNVKITPLQSVYISIALMKTELDINNVKSEITYLKCEKERKQAISFFRQRKELIISDCNI